MQMKDMSSMGSMGGMSMSAITWSTKCVVFLFQTFHAKNMFQFIVGCVIVCLVSIFSQMLSLPMFRDCIIGVTKNARKQSNSSIVLVGTQVQSDRATNQQRIGQHVKSSIKPNSTRFLFINKVRMTFFYFLSSLFSLLLMLVAMTMNGYVILSVALGMGIGKTVVNIMNEKILQKEAMHQNCCDM